MTRAHAKSRSSIVLATVLGLLLAPLPALLAPTTAHAATTNLVKLRVENARTGDAIPNRKFLITRTDSGNPRQSRTPNCMPNGNNPATDYPTGCDWPSVRVMTGGAGGAENLIAQGDQNDLNGTDGLSLPDGNYLISVTADTFKMDGKHFTVPLADPGLLTVTMNPDPHPLATIKIQVFNDSMTNGQFDPQSEAGLTGFVGHIDDVLGEVTTDWFGNPLCAQYDSAGEYIPGTGGACLSDGDGLITIPNIGPNRYEVTAVPPDGQPWVQTTTLEGAHFWDSWAFEGWDGLDNELLVNGAPVPWVQAGFVQPTTVSGGTGHLTGRVVSVKSYLPPAGGDTLEGGVPRPWLAVTDLLDNDRMVYAGRGNADGTFDIGGLPASDYQIAYWDQDQNYLLQLQNRVVNSGESVDVGDLQLSHWFSDVHGTVFLDTNKNGKRDTGEQPLKGQPVVLKSRDNSLVDQGSRAVVTDAKGHYNLKQVYPYGYWTVLEVYNDRFYTTGLTYQADNQPEETTVLGAGVDVATLNQDGLNSRIDWGVQPYAPGTNGGIVGTVVYNLTRNELAPSQAATEDYEPGIPNLTVKLFRPVDADGDGEYDTDPNGAAAKGPQIGEYLTETFERPTDCQARNAAGTPLDLEFAAPATGGFECVESPLMGNQVQTGFSTVNGNYGFGTVWQLDANGDPVLDENGDIVEDPMPAGDYLVEVEVPDDAFGKPKYKVTREEDVNVFDGSDFQPQVPPHGCSGPLHTVDVEGVLPDGADATPNPTFAEAGGSPYEGESRNLCNVKLIRVEDQRSVAPGFHYFTDVPQPGRLFGAVVEDLMLGTDPKEFYYGEKAGIPNAPIGVYDYTGKLVLNTQADPNGFFDILLPSTNTFNCPLPAGPCPNMYRVVGNDPGTPEHPNASYDPQYRTFATWWQIWPGLSLLADVALLPTAPVIETPGTVNTHPPACKPAPGTPLLFAVDTPFVNDSGPVTIEGDNFGDTQASGSVTLDGTDLPVSAWGDHTIGVTVPASMPAGPHQLSVTASNGLSAPNTLTFHVRDTGYLPTVFEVGPGETYATVQAGINAAGGTSQALVVVHPNTAHTYAPLGDYFENVVIHTPVKLQGVGPGGTRADGSSVKGSILNGTGFATTRANAWSTLVQGINSGPGWDGNQNIYDGQVVYVVAKSGDFTSGYQASVDGFSIEGGNEFGNEGTYVTPNYVTQGGGIFVNAYARNLQITNNVIRGNGGSFGGGVRVGTPYIGSNHNDNLRIAHNKIYANGGSNLAAGIGLFSGTNGYEIDHNDICGNFSAEYGGGISHFGLSGGTGNPAKIHDNQIWGNTSYDEGAGIMVAGEVTPTVSNLLTPGSGPVDIYDNLIQSNLSGDDGGGLRFLQTNNFPMRVYNNMIVNNVAAHEGGGVAIDDSPDIRFHDNTVMKNITTSTSAASTGDPVPTGLSTSMNSAQLQNVLPADAKNFSDPLLFNNIFWDNRAGHYDFLNNRLTGLGQAGDPTPVNVWDMGIFDSGPPKLSPTNSILTKNDPTYVNSSATNKVGGDPKVVLDYDTLIRALPWRGQPATVFTITISTDVPASVAGNYHLDTGSPAENSGAASKSGTSAPDHDIDHGNRPSDVGFEIGADEYPGPTVVAVGPQINSALVAPNPTNNTGFVTLRMSVGTTTVGSTIAAAEWFIGSDPGAGAGNPMGAVDGHFDQADEDVMATNGLNALPQGTNVINVRAMDAAGRWGASTTVTLHVDTTAPSAGSAATTPRSVPARSLSTLTASATDSGAGNTLAGAEWFDGTDPGTGHGHAMTAVDGAFDEAGETFRATVGTSGMSTGAHTLRVRSRDAAGNWSATRAVTLTVTPVIFTDSFTGGNTSAWSAATNPGRRLVVSTSAGMRGTAKGLRIRLGGPAAFVTDRRPAAETLYAARFWFDPNNSRTSSAGHSIFRASNGAAETFVVQYRHMRAADRYQVRLVVWKNTGSRRIGSWITIANAPGAYEVEWRAGTSTTTRLLVNGVQKAALTANTAGRRVETAQLGAVSAPGATSSGYEFFDAFLSTRGPTVGT